VNGAPCLLSGRRAFADARFSPKHLAGPFLAPSDRRSPGISHCKELHPMHAFRRTALALAMSGTLATPGIGHGHRGATPDDCALDSEPRACERLDDVRRATAHVDLPGITVHLDSEPR
jgi:hypothetical protein